MIAIFPPASIDFRTALSNAAAAAAAASVCDDDCYEDHLRRVGDSGRGAAGGPVVAFGVVFFRAAAAGDGLVFDRIGEKKKDVVVVDYDSTENSAVVVPRWW